MPPVLEDDDAEGLPLPVALPPTLPSLNSRIEAAIAALPTGSRGAAFLYADVENGQAVGKVALVQKLGDHWSIDIEGHVAKKAGEPWRGGKWDKGASLLVRGVW